MNLTSLVTALGTRGRTVSLMNTTAVLEVAPDLSGYQALPLDFFSSALPVGSNTGVLRNLATRMNTSIDCHLIPQSDFPATCPNKNGFFREFSNIANDSDPYPFYSGILYPGHPRYRGRICVPVRELESPWINIADRQDIQEDLWIDFQSSNPTHPKGFGGYYLGLAERVNFIQRCTSNSTLGFFELPNYWNGQTVGPLLTQVSSSGRNETYDNFYSMMRSSYSIPDSSVPGP